MKKVFYFRVGGATATEDDNTTGSNLYPVENFMGMCSGTSDGNGAITDDDNAVSLFLKPILKTQTSEAAAGDADPDVLVLACAQYGQKLVMKHILAAMNGGPHDEGFITLYDGYADKPAADPTTSIPGVTGITVVAQQAAAD
tara:strand:+ start:310 stop:735 length:426 start_codon:yes stop_codon:yes gene_type:complete